MFELKIFMQSLPIGFHILGLIRELKHSNSNMRHLHLISKGSHFFGTCCICVYVQNS